MIAHMPLTPAFPKWMPLPPPDELADPPEPGRLIIGPSVPLGGVIPSSPPPPGGFEEEPQRRETASSPMTANSLSGECFMQNSLGSVGVVLRDQRPLHC